MCLLLLENNKGESNDKDIKEQFTIRDITKSEHKVNREKKKKGDLLYMQKGETICLTMSWKDDFLIINKQQVNLK